MSEINLRNYAHLGDAVWELFVREHIIDRCVKTKDLHKMTTSKVKAEYQAELLQSLEEELTEKEEDLKRRARNMEVPPARRKNQFEYRLATAFEALIGYWYKEDKNRLDYIFKKLLSKIYE